MWVDVIGEIKRRYAQCAPQNSRLQALARNGGLVFSQGDGSGGSGLTLSPSDGEYSSLFVWLHGLGDTPFSWYGAFNWEQQSFDNGIQARWPNLRYARCPILALCFLWRRQGRSRCIMGHKCMRGMISSVSMTNLCKIVLE